MARLLLGVLIAVTVAGRAQAQSFNVDFGHAGDTPASTYAAAGQAGVWNGVEGEDAPMTTYPLVDITGAATGVTLYNIGGTDLIAASDPSVSGDDARLMNDALVTYTSSLETCLFVDGLMPGTYEVTMYAWMPSAPAVRSRVRHDLSGTTIDVGGAWPGAHADGVTYARHTLVIPSDGALRSHSGIVPGMPELAGAALNGFQLRLVDCPTCPDAGPPPPTDAGVGATDMGSAGTDMGSAGMDAGSVPDAGSGGIDMGVAAPHDAGTSASHGGCSVSAPTSNLLPLLPLLFLARRRRR